MSEAKYWLVVHTRAGSERRAYKHLMFQGFAPLFLHYKADRRLSNGSIIHDIWRPYMPRYLYSFTEIGNVFKINNSFGVAGVLRGAGGPLTVPAEVIEEQLMRAHAGINGVVPPPSPEMRRRFARWEQIRITAGPFMGFLAVVQDDAGDKIRAWVSCFGRDINAILAPEQVELRM